MPRGGQAIRAPLGTPPGLWVAALLPRFALLALAWAHPERCLRPDSESYRALARNLVLHGVFSTNAAAPFSPDAFRTPGYPLFLAAVGLRPEFAALWQCLAGAAAAVLAFRWLRPAFGERGARAAALLLALDPVILWHTPLTLTETLFTLLCVLAGWATWRGLSRAGAPQAALAGSLWGAATLLRPAGLYLPALLVWFWRRAPKSAALFLLCAYLLPAGWTARNWATFGHPVFATVSDFNLLRYPAAGVEALRTGRSWAEADAALREDIRLEAGGGPEAPGDPAWAARCRRRAVAILASHPLLAARYALAGSVKLLGGTGWEMLLEWVSGQARAPTENRAGIAGSGTLSLLRAYPALIPFQLAYMLALTGLYAMAIRGALRLWRSGRRSEASYLCLCAAYFWLIASANSEGYYRYRIPMMPFLAALAAAGWPRDRPSA